MPTENPGRFVNRAVVPNDYVMFLVEKIPE
jgi:hypothetical protein